MTLRTLAFASLLIGLATQHTMVMFHYPRWSPDGKWIVLTSNIDGADEEVWLISPDDQTKRKLTDNTVDDVGADWHPDGRRLVFMRHGTNGMQHFVMNMDGSNIQPYQPAGASAVRGLTVAEKSTPKGQAIVVSRNGAQERAINEVAWAEQPSISPDGTLVVFEQRETEHDVLASNIALWDSRTAKTRIVAKGTDPSWSPDGRLLLFKTPRPDNALFITTLNLSTGEIRSLAPGVHPHFSPDGTSIAYMADARERADVYVMRVDGSGKRCLTCGWK